MLKARKMTILAIIMFKENVHEAYLIFVTGATGAARVNFFGRILAVVSYDIRVQFENYATLI